MTDYLVAWLRRDVSRVFGGARHITVLTQRHGRLVPTGEPMASEITSAAMLLASVHIRLPSGHPYVSAAIPAAALLRGVQESDRGAILLAPVIEDGVPVGVVIVEAQRGHVFSMRDLSCLEIMTASAAQLPSQA